MIYGTWENSQILGQIKKFYAKLGYFWQHPSSILGNFLLHIRKFLPKKQDPGRKNTFSIYASGYGGGVGVEFTLFCLGLSWWRRKFKVVQDQSSEEDWSEKRSKLYSSCTLSLNILSHRRRLVSKFNQRRLFLTNCLICLISKDICQKNLKSFPKIL